MPMTINVGLSRKVGLPDYGSAGASCHIEFEAEHGLLDRDLDAFQERVRKAFVVCWPSSGRISMLSGLSSGRASPGRCAISARSARGGLANR